MPTSEREKEIVREYLIDLQFLVHSGEEPPHWDSLNH